MERLYEVTIKSKIKVVAISPAEAKIKGENQIIEIVKTMNGSFFHASAKLVMEK